MTDEELAAIRGRAKTGFPGDIANMRSAIEDRAALLAEVERFRGDRAAELLCAIVKDFGPFRYRGVIFTTENWTDRAEIRDGAEHQKFGAALAAWCRTHPELADPQLMVGITTPQWLKVLGITIKNDSPSSFTAAPPIPSKLLADD